jgi:hypothetical protein
MSSVKRLFIAFGILTGTALACSLNVDLGTTPAGTPTLRQSGLDQVSTMVAQTLQAFTQEAPTGTPTPTNTPVTPTLTPPTLTVSADTNCYAGPSTSYGFVITLHPGTIAVPVGKDASLNYWLIQTPNYPASTCWVSGTYATLTGDFNSLPEVSAPSLTSYTLSEPKSLNVSCTSQAISSSGHHHDHWDDDSSDWTVYFRWKNTEPNQSAVRVYRNGRLIATLGGHGSSYTDEFRHENHHYDVTYGVQAVNGYQVSSIVTIDVRHCPGD